MQAAERITLVLILLVLATGIGWVVYMVQAHSEDSGVLSSSRVDNEQMPIAATEYAVDDERRYFPETVPLQVGATTWRASVADSLPERIQGLSNTPFLPVDMVKWFDFAASGQHSIWMKDMQYPLDIVWLSETGEVVHIETNVSPNTFPASFSSPIPAWYVLEANVGFVASTSLMVGDTISLPVY